MNMRAMNGFFPLLAAAAVAAIASSAAAQGAPTAVPLDGELTAGGTTFACTGVGQTRNDPKWRDWPLRVEFSNPRRDLLTDGAVAVLDAAGGTIAAVTCEGPWILIRPGPGVRSIAGWLPGVIEERQRAAIGPPGRGQRTIELQFATP